MTDTEADVERPRWIEYRRLSEIPRALSNPKGHDADLIADSIRRHGFVESVAIDERTGRLVSGHGRLDFLEAGWKAGEDIPEGILTADDGEWMAPVERGWASADDDEAERYLLVANQATIAGGWDQAMLAESLSRLSASRDVLAGTGFNADYLDDMLAALGPIKIDSPFGGGYAENPAAIADREGAAGTPREAVGLKEVILVFPVDEHGELIEKLRALRAEWGTESTSATVLECVRRAVT